MKRSLILYIKSQMKNLVALLLIFVLPFLLFLKLSPYEIPMLQYYILGSLIVYQYVLFDEKSYKHKLERIGHDQLKRELGRIPSKSEIVERVNSLVGLRHVSILITILTILSVMVFY